MRNEILFSSFFYRPEHIENLSIMTTRPAPPNLKRTKSKHLKISLPDPKTMQAVSSEELQELLSPNRKTARVNDSFFLTLNKNPLTKTKSFLGLMRHDKVKVVDGPSMTVKGVLLTDAQPVPEYAPRIVLRTDDADNVPTLKVLCFEVAKTMAGAYDDSVLQEEFPDGAAFKDVLSGVQVPFTTRIRDDNGEEYGVLSMSYGGELAEAAELKAGTRVTLAVYPTGVLTNTEVPSQSRVCLKAVPVKAEK